MWFHRPFRAGRGMIFQSDGTLVASGAQGGSLRQSR
jgi:acyl-CoA thioesterase